MKNAKRNIIIGAVLLLVCAAVYLNWSYNQRWGGAEKAMVEAEDAAREAAMESEGQAQEVSDYFAQARLTRQTSRDEALSLLQTAAAGESASQETIDSAMNAIAAMANYSMQEAQVENLLIAKDFADCVVFMSGEGVTVAVPAPVEGLSDTQVARITEIITGETDFTPTMINVIEIKEASQVVETASLEELPEPETAE